MHPSTDPKAKYNQTAPGRPCTLAAPSGTPAGALACATFICGTTGQFTVSACIGGESGPGWEGHCADEKEACALAYEANEHSLAGGLSTTTLCK